MELTFETRGGGARDQLAKGRHGFVVALILFGHGFLRGPDDYVIYFRPRTIPAPDGLRPVYVGIE